MSVPLDRRFARNGGQGSIEESEIFILRWDLLGFGVILGPPILREKRRRESEKGDLYRGPGRDRGSLLQNNCLVLGASSDFEVRV